MDHPHMKQTDSASLDRPLIHSASLPPARILIVDDHGIVRDGIRVLLRQQGLMDVVGLAGTGEPAVVAAQRLKPDVIIMDLVLPVLNGIGATQRILKLLPQTKCGPTNGRSVGFLAESSPKPSTATLPDKAGKRCQLTRNPW
jgi:CheY-like chemotaxis protein